MPFFKKITIIGVGLIGGSLGMAIKRRGLARWVVGVVRRKATAVEALRRGALDVATMNLAEGVKDADLVILCAPVSTIIRQLKEVARHAKPGAIIIDVGSAKDAVDRTARKYFVVGAVTKPVPKFVGCHPMAGSEHKGVEFASAELFKDAQCFMTSRHKKIEQFWKALGAKPVFIDSRVHDAWVARTSYLPHILAFSLFQKQTLGKFSSTRLNALNPSIREFARLAKSDPALWTDILLTSAESLSALMDLEKSLRRFRQLLAQNEPGKLNRYMRAANRLSRHITEVNSERR